MSPTAAAAAAVSDFAVVGTVIEVDSAGKGNGDAAAAGVDVRVVAPNADTGL